jgi:hypothetical protein
MTNARMSAFGASSPQRSPTRNTPRRDRGTITKALCLIAASGALFSLSGCRSRPPSVPEIERQYNEGHRQLKEIYDQMMKGCRESADPASCESAVRAWYLAALDELRAIQYESINKNWDDAYERRKALEEALRQLIPAFPKIKDITLPFAPQSSVSFDLTGTPITMSDPCEPIIAVVAGMNPGYESVNLASSASLSTAVSQNPCFMAVGNGSGTYALALAGQTLTINGTAALANDEFSTTASIAGSIALAGAVLDDQSYTGVVQSGVLTVNIAYGGIATLQVVPDDANVIDIAPNGAGTVTTLFTLAHSDVAWNAVLPGYVRIQLPVTRAANGALTIQFGPTPTADLVPFQPHPLSDYNGDGVWDYASDLAEFMIDFADQRLIADIDDNGIWDSNDIDLWTNIFWHDALHN